MAWDDDAEAGIDKAESAAGTEIKRTAVAPIRAVVEPIEEKAKDLWSRLWKPRIGFKKTRSSRG